MLSAWPARGQNPGMADVLSTGPDRPRWSPPRWLRVAGVVLLVVAAAGVVRGQLGSPPGRPAPTAATGGPQPATSTTDAPLAPLCAQAVPTDPPGSASGDGQEPPIAGLAIAQAGSGGAIERRDRGAAAGPWTVVVRLLNGSLGRHGAVVTYPVRPLPLSGPARVGRVLGRAAAGVVVWPLAGRYARIRGDLAVQYLTQIAAATTVRAGRPEVHPPRGYLVAATGPYRSPSIRELRYGPDKLGPAGRVLGGMIYTGITTGGGGFEDALYTDGDTLAGAIDGRTAVESLVYGGNSTLAWELSAGLVAYIGYSGAPSTADTNQALHCLAEQTHLLTPPQWRAAHPQTIDQINAPD